MATAITWSRAELLRPKPPETARTGIFMNPNRRRVAGDSSTECDFRRGELSMKPNETLDAGGASAPEAVEPVMLEPDAIIEQLRALSRQIPQFGHLPVPARQALRAAVNADPA